MVCVADDFAVFAEEKTGLVDTAVGIIVAAVTAVRADVYTGKIAVAVICGCQIHEGRVTGIWTYHKDKSVHM